VLNGYRVGGSTVIDSSRNINLISTGATSPIINFSNNDAGIDFAIRSNSDALDFYEPEDSDKLQMRITDDIGVNAVFGLRTGSGNGTLRIDASGNATLGTISATSLDLTTNALSLNSANVRLKTQKTINLTAFSTSNFYPVVLTNPGNVTSTHHFVISQNSQSGNDPYNNNMIVGWARGQGWSDMTLAYDFHYNAYQDNERTILGMYRGTASSNVIIFYLRGGETYYFHTESDATVYTSGYNSGTSSTSLTVAMVKDANGNDITGQSDASQQLNRVADILGGGQGYYRSHSYLNHPLTMKGNSSVDSGSFTLNGGSGVGALIMNYQASSTNYRGLVDWRTLHLGNNGENNILAGNTSANGFLRFWVNATSDSISGGTSGTNSLTLNANGTSTFTDKVIITNSTYGSHIDLIRDSDTINLSPSAGQLLVSGGFSPSVSNSIDLGRTDKYWQDLWLGTSLKMGGTTVIDSSRNITGVTGYFYKAGTSNTQTTVLTLGSNSTRPVLQFSESMATGLTSGMSIEYNGFATGVSNYIAVNNVAGSVVFRVYSGGDIQTTGNITAYASDARLKTNIKPIESALEKVQLLRGVEFDWRDDVEEKGFNPSVRHETGVIAQEVQEVIPDAVVPAPFDDNYLTVQHQKIIPVLIEAIKEQQEQIEELKAIIKEKLNGNN
jgi:hypothetical protein